MKKVFPLLLVSALACTAFAWRLASDYTPAAYPGGKEAMQKYLVDSLRYPDSARAAGLEAVVNVSFQISKNGALDDLRASGFVHNTPAFTREAIRLVRAMPRWEPAMDGRKKTVGWSEVQVRFELPDSLVHLPPPSGDTTVYTDLDTVPVFLGGESGMQQYIQNTIRYPQAEKETGKGNRERWNCIHQLHCGDEWKSQQCYRS